MTRWAAAGEAISWLGRNGARLAVGYCCVAISAWIAWRAAPDDTTRAIAMICLAVVSIVPPWLLALRRYGMLALSMTIVVPAWGYVAATSYVSLGRAVATKAAATGKADDRFGAAKATLDRLRAERAAITTARSVERIDVDLSWHVSTQQRPAPRGAAVSVPAESADVRDLRGERADAVRRDRLDGEIREAEAAFAAATPSAGVSAAGKRPALLAWLRARTRIDFETWADLQTMLMLIVVELGAGLLPLVAERLRSGGAPGTSAGTGSRPPVSAARKAAPDQSAEAGAASLETAPETADAALVRVWAAERLARPAMPGAWTGSGTLYRDFSAWARARGAAAPGHAQWGQIMAERQGMASTRRGKGRSRFYPVTLRASAGARPVRVIDGGLGSAPAAAMREAV